MGETVAGHERVVGGASKQRVLPHGQRLSSVLLEVDQAVFGGQQRVIVGGHQAVRLFKLEGEWNYHDWPVKVLHGTAEETTLHKVEVICNVADVATDTQYAFSRIVDFSSTWFLFKNVDIRTSKTGGTPVHYYH